MSVVPDSNQLRDEWLQRLADLIGTVQGWADELDWSTRRIEVTLNDSQLGKYNAPALLIQEDAIRILLEPIARSAPGADGVVDLYLMPGYDDIASLYLGKQGWVIHYMFSDAKRALLTKDSLRDVLEKMKTNAV